jgi:hypothetical protein
VKKPKSYIDSEYSSDEQTSKYQNKAATHSDGQSLVNQALGARTGTRHQYKLLTIPPDVKEKCDIILKE